MSKRLVALCAVLVLGPWLAHRSAAYEPQAAFFNVVEFSEGGEFSPGIGFGGDARVLIGLRALGEEFANSNILVVFRGCGEDSSTPNRPVLNLDEVLRSGAKPRFAEEWQDLGPRWRICSQDQAVLIEGGQPVQLSVFVDFLRDDISEGLSPRLPAEVHILSDEDLEKIDREKGIGCQWEQIIGQRRPTSRFMIDLYYRVDGPRHIWSYGTYPQIFGEPSPDELFGRPTGDYASVASQLSADILSFRSNRRIPGETENDGGRLFRETLRRVRADKSALVGQEACVKEDFQANLPVDGVPRASRSQSLAALSYNVSGRFSTKWTADHSLHPGFGFRVEAWTDDFFGIWIKIGEDWVQSDGTWSLNLPGSPIFNGNRLRVFYGLHTSYYDIKDLNSNRYRWVDPDWTNISQTFSVGHRFADTDGGVYNGVGEAADAAMYTWSRLYWNGGINPVPANPINVFTPNTTYDCGDGSGNPWSCASVDGNIWLIASHAVQAQTVAHELSHQLNYLYWGYKRPANPGGSHNLNSCYSTRIGMTLLEGFADFMAGWVGYPGRSVADGGFGSGRWTLGWDLEDRTAPPSCTNGWENETWVARTFWDLHDTRADGDDILWFNNLGAAPVLYLANGVAKDGDARDMRDYETTYRGAASPGHQGFITDIFEQNRH